MDKNELANVIGEVLGECTARGMELPFIVCSASPNGSVLAVRCNSDDEPDVLAEHYESAGFAMPMTIMVLDQQNVAVRITIDADGKTWH
jgi:hypothetical protein